MSEYTLKRNGPIVQKPGVRWGLGDVPFEAEDDLAAIRFAQVTYAEAIAEADYAAVWNAEGKPIWESGPWNA